MAACIRGPRSVRGSIDNLHKANNVQYKSIIQVYTDWANHYLEKARCKKQISDLQQDTRDGVLLADLIEAVTGQRVPEIHRRPKTSAQMTDNVRSCLSTAALLGVAADGVTARDIREGSLKAVLGLFFALSKQKQQQKQQQQQQIERDKQRGDMINSRLPSPFHGNGAGNVGPVQTSIPTPIHRTSAQVGGSPLKCTSASSSRSTSPSHSFIPTPRTRTSINDKQHSSGISNSSIRPPGSVGSPYTSTPKNNVLDKLKLLNPTDKNKQVGSTKRTSSSSGFSSARSERSDSSTSLYNDYKSSIPEKKESSQNDLSLKSGLRKKVIKISGDTKVSRVPSRTNVTKIVQPTTVNEINTSRLLQPSVLSEYNTSKLIQPPALSEKPSPIPESPEKKEIIQTVIKTQGGEKMVEEGVKAIVSPGGGSGIPKPTAAVKGMAKPTHSVAPMPQTPPATAPSQPPFLPVDNKISPVEKTEPVVNEEEKDKDKDKEKENGHVKQLSVGEEEEGSEVVKPMQPLLRGYKSTIAITPRPHTEAHPGWRGVSQYTDGSSRVSVEGDHPAGLSSGYVSDGDILNRAQKCDTTDGYISEGGAIFYTQRAQERLQRGSNSPLELKGSVKPNTRPQRDGRRGEPVSNELRILSSEDLNHYKRGAAPGPVGGGRPGGYEPPLSPPEPQPVVYRVYRGSHIKKSDSSQQTENSAFRQVSSSQWKKYVEGVGAVGRVPELGRHKADMTDGGRKPKQQSSHNGLPRKPDKKRMTGSKEELGPEDFANGDRKTRESKSKVRGVPPNFGYIKRSMNGNGKGEPRTAQVSAVPRTKVKVSGGTQTDIKSYSVGGSTGAQLSASVRERLMQGGPVRGDPGCLSDSNYAELNMSPYSGMYRHTTAYTSSLPARATAAGLIEADSIESLPAQLHHRASLTHPRLIGPSPPSPSPSQSNRLSRSNSIRSTKSEKLYPSMLQRSEELEPYYSIPYGLGPGSQPTSPTPSQMSQGTINRFNYPISPISASPSSHMISRTYPYGGLMTKMNSKDDDVHGSAISLVSTASSLYSTPEEKQAHELRKLRRELGDAQEKVLTLTSQLSTNAHVVSAFEQSLSNMTQRLQQLTATSEKKDCELMELRQTIELLRKQSQEAGLTSAPPLSPSSARRHTLNTAADANERSNIARQLSTDSVSSLNSLSSACSLSSAAHITEADKKKKRGWLRSSFNKAFSRTKKNRAGSVSDAEDGGRGMSSDLSAPSSPLLGHAASYINGDDHISSDNHTNSTPYEKDSVVDELRKQLREKDLVLTDIRLEALSSAHQLESLKDTVIKMRNEMVNLKQDNDRLQRIVTSKSLTSSQSSLPLNEVERRFSMGDAITSDERTSLFSGDPDGKRVVVSVFLGPHGSYHQYIEENAPTCPIATVSVSGKTKWDMLDAMVRRAFKEYCERLDPLSSLGGLTADCIWSYHVGEIVRYRDSGLPDLLPCGYLLGDNCQITVCLKGALHSGSVDALVFQTLIPKSIVQRYVSLLTDHRRIILCGPSGTGKTYLATRLAEFLVLRAGKDSTAESIATFNVDHKSSAELGGYLSHVAEQCEHSAADLPNVIILDNLQHSLGEVFNSLLTAKSQACPFIIGTMNQATCATTNLQLHHNFRWVLCANHMEPVKGLLGRVLARRLVEAECRAGQRDADLARAVEWLPRVLNHLNQFLETHSSSDVTIGPRLFLQCPMDADGAQVWFTDLWNYSLVPYLVDAVREGLQLYGRRAPFDDPTSYVCQTYPWLGEAVTGGSDALIRLRPEDVGYDATERDRDGTINSIKSLGSDSDADPLLNMLMRLQEAANYPSPRESTPSPAPDNPRDSCNIESTL